MRDTNEVNTERIREYLAKSDALAKSEPPMFADEETDTETSEEWEAWNRENNALIEEYKDAILSAITSRVYRELGSGDGTVSVNTLLRQLVDDTEEITEVPVAHYITTETFSNHALILKVLNEGLFAIAMGQPSYVLAPKRNHSRESWKLTAAAESCTQFFTAGGNAEVAKDVLETVYTLRTDRQAEGFVYRGRVWFTVNTILQEMLRTKGGTSRARDKKVNREVVDAALLAASSAQIVGTDPAGYPTDAIYLLNAIRREKVTYGKHEYTDVWGFELAANTANDYARELKHGYTYPLLDMDRALTLDESWIDRYLKDAINVARGKLYGTTRDGKPKRTRFKKWTVRRSWPSIFQMARPLKTMTSRQKNSLVKDFQTVLEVLAEMEAHDKLRPGYPMYIRAYSERNPGRGRGKGAWVNLVLECSVEFHAPEIDLS